MGSALSCKLLISNCAAKCEWGRLFLCKATCLASLRIWIRQRGQIDAQVGQRLCFVCPCGWNLMFLTYTLAYSVQGGYPEVGGMGHVSRLL